jgi:glycosyltransferase involved in cell wall biosynthesis/putative flippase GtrA
MNPVRNSNYKKIMFKNNINKISNGMKVISIGTDRKLFEEGSAIRQRVVEYGKLFEELHVVVFTTKSLKLGAKSLKIAENVFVYATNSRNKMFYLYDAFNIGKVLISKLKNSSCVVTIQDPFETGLVGLGLKLFYKLPLQIQLHTDFANRYFITDSILNFIRFPLGIFVLSFADSVRCVSERVAKSIYSLSHNISILPIWVSNEIRSTSYETRKEPGEINFLTVCRLEKEKDLATAIKAFKKVLDKGLKAKFTIVGDGSQRKKLAEMCKELKIESNVIFVGWQNDPEIYYKNADIYVSTSLYEGYGMSAVEAAFFSLPLILSDTGVAGFADGFIDKESAFVCKQRNVNCFAEAMFKLTTDSDLRFNMGKTAKHTAEGNRISFNEYLEKYKNSIKQAADFYNSGHGVFKKNILLRYFVSGISGASTQIGLLYVFTDVVGLWYIYSSVLAFVVAIAISFVLQKFWTFADRETKKVHQQFARYMVVAILGVFINTFSMYIFVDIFAVWYILSQIFTGVIIAILNFFMYKFFIFNKK